MLKKIMIGTALAGILTTSAMAWDGYRDGPYAYDNGPAVGIGVGPFGIYAGAAPYYGGYGSYAYEPGPYDYRYGHRHHLRHHRMQGHSDMNRQRY